MPRRSRPLRAEQLEPRHLCAATAVGSPVVVNDLIGGAQAAAVTASSVAGMVVAYQGQGPTDRQGIYAEVLSSTGATVRAAFPVNTTITDSQHSPAVAMASDGTFVVVWAGRGAGDKAGVFAQRFNSAGVAQGGETLINPTTGGVQAEPAVAMQADGSFVVAWSGVGAGDVSGVFLRRFTTAGVAVAGEVHVNTATANTQSAPSLAFDSNGNLLVAWQSRQQDGSDWGIYGQWFDSAGARLGAELRINTTTTGSQSAPTVATDPTGGVVAAWQSFGQDGDSWAVVARKLRSDGTGDAEVQLNTATAGHQQDVSLAITSDGQWLAAWSSGAPNGAGWEAKARLLAPGGQTGDAELNLGASGANSGWQQAPSVTIAGTNAAIVWQGAVVGDRNGVSLQRLTVDAINTTPQQAPSLAEITDRTAAPVNTLLEVMVAATDPNAGDTLTYTLDPNNSPATARIEKLTNNTAVIRWTPTPLEAGQAVNFRVLVTDNGVTPLTDSEDFTVNVAASDPANLVAFAQALAATTTRFFGAAWNETTTQQKELFQDGGQFLPFFEVTNADRTLNALGTQNNVALNQLPTWVFPDGTRATGVLSLQTIAQRSGVIIPAGNQPFLVAPANATLLVGSPLHVSLDGYDPGGGLLTYEVTSDNPNVAAQILSGSRSARVSVAGFGDMVFELFEQEASRATNQLIALAENDFHEDIIFHRIINNFVIQGGDPTGTGSGGSTLGDFDDQFDVDLQHNRTGLLSMAKSDDDTNDSQFFITEGTNTSNLRNLDFNHTIFGVLVEGEANRAAISDTPTGAGDRPVTPVVMDGIEIFDDQENAVLRLTAAAGATGTANITVTVRDQAGNSAQRMFTVTLAADTFNGRPFLIDLPPVTTPRNTVGSLLLVSSDVEGDPVFYTAQRLGTSTATVTVSPAGVVQVTPPTDFVGFVDVLVGVGRAANSPDDTQIIRFTFT